MLLVPMTESDYQTFSARAITEYAAGKVASGEWSASESMQLAAASLQALLPGGLATPGHYLFTLRAGRDMPAVGVLWYAEQARAGRRIAYLYDIHIDAEHQRHGHATAALLALEREVTGRGLSGIALHVFGHNAAAQALYQRLGFTPTNINMFKSLGADR